MGLCCTPRWSDEKSAPSTSFLQCSLAVLITRWSSSFYSSSSHLSSVGCSAVFAEYPLLQPHDNWLPLCLQAERETREGEREHRKEWEKLECPAAQSWDPWAEPLSLLAQTNTFMAQNPTATQDAISTSKQPAGPLACLISSEQRAAEAQAIWALDRLSEKMGRKRMKGKDKGEGEERVVVCLLVTLLILGKDRNLWWKWNFVCFWGADFWSFCVLL